MSDSESFASFILGLVVGVIFVFWGVSCAESHIHNGTYWNKQRTWIAECSNHSNVVNNCSRAMNAIDDLKNVEHYPAFKSKQSEE